MDSSYSDSDISLSPSQVLERLELLRQLQIFQRGKLQKYSSNQTTPENSSNVTELVSHFENSTSYQSFRSLLQSPCGTSQNGSTSNTIEKLNKQSPKHIMEGVELLNLSLKSESLNHSPRSHHSFDTQQYKIREESKIINRNNFKTHKKHILVEEMPILSPKKSFEELMVEKLNNENTLPVQKTEKKSNHNKKPFLKRGEGMSRFGISRNVLVIQNTKSLPWRKKSITPNTAKQHSLQQLQRDKNEIKNIGEQVTKLACDKIKNLNLIETESIDATSKDLFVDTSKIKQTIPSKKEISNDRSPKYNKLTTNDSKNKSILKSPPIKVSGKTWASVLTKEQDDFLRQLKQSDYYKNFASPTKSIESEYSVCGEISKSTDEREIIEQKIFELIENKVGHESFNMENSFISNFLRKRNLEGSGESTPLVMQRCLSNNPALMHISPNLNQEHTNSHRDIEYSRASDYSDCNESCCATESSCSCSTITQKSVSKESSILKDKQRGKSMNTKNKENIACQKESVVKPDSVKDSDNDTVNENMVEMNAKLIATSELLKERLHELEDEIETFRKENANLNKMREEVDIERQKFYEEKAAFEQKYNEDKVLSEYYLAEEKEKLAKQRQLYERYVRDMRGKLSKREKDEVSNLKKEIIDMKEEIKIKDAKSTSTIARLRNQIKLIEKDKKALEGEVEKLKKENRRIQHSNDMTRRLTNLKYLEQINKKLSDMTLRDTQSNLELDSNIKYKAFEIEKQSLVSRNKALKPRTRAKSVPNLNVTSKYAKYFSQKDSMSDKDKYPLSTSYVTTAADPCDNNNSVVENNDGSSSKYNSDDENYLERIYNERFKSNSPPSNKSSETNLSYSSDKNNFCDKKDTNDFFIEKSHSVSTSRGSLTPSDRLSNISKSKNQRKTVTNIENGDDNNVQNSYGVNRNKSPVSILSNRSSGSQKPITVINNEDTRLIPSPEPTISKTSLNPTEYIKADGTRELRFPNGNVKTISSDGQYSKFMYYNGDIKENFFKDGRVKYFYADGQIEKRYKDGSSEIRLPNGSIRYFDPKNEHVREEWRFPDGTALTISANGEQRIVFPNGQIEFHTKDHKH
ncbi:unnamed protein product [Leptidea sinapis]|uniref:Centromere protein J C-terminal domain-containing protein n=1 Tax=Leptidea sinapis TaxID=189913 RepID=A0A5E4PS66_9NEOP|nr:unnamed protein product [Leptidea sinapis]